MGDRANVLVKADKKDKGVYLYTHWHGSQLPRKLGISLGKRWRWDDAQYLARIIFDDMIGELQGGETGFGISSMPGDGTDRVLIVDCSTKTVTDANLDEKKTFGEWTFEEYLKGPQRWNREEN